MKKIFRYAKLIVVIVALSFVSCENSLETPVEFDVQIANSDSFSKNDAGILTIPTGTSVTFLFSGNANYISFDYDIFNKTTPTLSFKTKLGWANNVDALQLYVATDFPGLTKTSAVADSTTIADYKWVNLSDSCTWPTVKNDIKTSSFSLESYRGQNIVLAFRYKTTDNSAIQPMFTLSGLQLVNTVKKTGKTVSTVKASNMGFQPFDMFNMVPDSMAYRSSSTDNPILGVWDVSFSDADDNTAIKIRQTMKGKDLNEDWLISRAISIPEGATENGEAVAVKNITADVTSYDYIFDETGEYTLTFKATNANYKYHSSTERTIQLVVVE